MKDSPHIWQKMKFYLANTLEMMTFVGVNAAADAERQKTWERERKYPPPHGCRHHGSG